MKNDKARKPISQRQLNDIINVGRDGVEVKGDAITSLCEVDTFVGAKDGGRLDFVVTSRDEEAGVHTVKDVDVEFVTTLCTYAPIVWSNDAATCSVDGFTILVQPFT